MKRTVFTLAIALCAVVSFAQQQMPPIPIDQQVRIGHLENGITYYIRHNEEPKGQANFYIAQKVGSILEEDSQRGLAHFLEHMCFNGTQKFPGNGVIKYCESIGVQFGGDLNAYTSIDETVYNIDNVPVGNVPSAVDSCLWILHDWADGLLLTDEDIDHERGVIHEEWRSRNGGSAQLRMLDELLPKMYPNNRYAYRMPIGIMEVVDFFPYQALRDYYEKWYRPDQQGIVVVGDIDVDAVEAKIKDIFGTIAKPVNPAERYYVPVEDNAAPIVAMATDKEQPYSVISLYFKHDAVADSEKFNMDYFLYDYAREMASDMLSARLEEMTQSANPIFIQSYAYDGGFFVSKTKSAFTGIAVVNEKDVAKGISSLYREILRAERNGFTESEYERARTNYLAHLESAYNERDKVKSVAYCKQYVRHFIDNEPIPGAENRYILAQQILPNVPVAVINELFKSFINENNLVVVCMLPEKEGVTYPTEAEAAKILTDVSAETISAYEDKVSNEPLIAKMPKGGKVVTTEAAPFGYKKLTLSNGAVVYLKSTDFKADEITMTAISEGGTSLYREADAINLKVAEEVCALGGLGKFSMTELTKALAGKKVSINPSINMYSESLDGQSTPKDFETLLQLSYLSFTAPRTDNEAFESWKNKNKAMLVNAASNPMRALGDTITKELYPQLPRLKRLTLEEIDKVDYARVMKIAKERFANAADFSFIFTGNIDETVAIPLIEKYIGSLPARGKKETFHDVGAQLRKGVRSNIFNREMEIPTATVLLAWSGEATYDLKNKLAFSIADQVLDIVMTEEIREKEGGTYGVSVSTHLNFVPSANVFFQVYYQTDPQKYEKLNARIEEIIADFAQNGPSETNLAKVKEYMLKKYNENLRNNGYFERNLSEYLRNGNDMLTEYEKVLNGLTGEDIRLAFADLLRQGNKALVVMSGVEKK